MRISVLLISMLLCLRLQECAAQTARVVKWAEMEEALEGDAQRITVINFWATWCKPCVAELPYFTELQGRADSLGLKILLVSLDRASEFESKILPLIRKRNLKSEVWLLDEPQAYKWVDKVDPSWSGTIPATMVIGKGGKARHMEQLEFHSAEEIVTFMKTHLP